MRFSSQVVILIAVGMLICGTSKSGYAVQGLKPCFMAHNCKKVYGQAHTCTQMLDVCSQQGGGSKCQPRWQQCMQSGSWPAEAGPGARGLKKE